MKRSSLPSVRMARLDEIGFVWAPREAAWEAMFNELKRYRERMAIAMYLMDGSKIRNLLVG